MSDEQFSAPISALLTRLDDVLQSVERLLAVQTPEQDAAVLDSAIAFRWQPGAGGSFRPIRHPDLVEMEQLIGLERQRRILVQNTQQCLAGAPANHVLLWGERGSGKSSIVKALLGKFHTDGLRLIQLYRHDLRDLPEILDRLWERSETYILFCDDLSFEEGDVEYKELKALLEGGLTARPRNVLVYATSNRRHLMPERMADRQGSGSDDEIHPLEAMEEKLSLADRFGIRLGFYPISQQVFLDIVRSQVQARGLHIAAGELDREALRWSLTYNGRSGRSARQFVDDLEGRMRLAGQ